jgi:hypothetical protein
MTRLIHLQKQFISADTPGFKRQSWAILVYFGADLGDFGLNKPFSSNSYVETGL